jgi:hypothetical protein
MTYRSKFEEKLAALPSFANAEYEHYKFAYPQPDGWYLLDFKLPNGIGIEAKGFFSASDRTKMKAVRSTHPDLDLRLVLQTPYKTLSKASMTTYAMWCEQHRFQWCAGNDFETLAAWAAEEPLHTLLYGDGYE